MASPAYWTSPARKLSAGATAGAIATAITFCLPTAQVPATPPYPTTVIRPERGPYVVEFHPRGAPIIVRNTESKTSFEISLDQFGTDKSEFFFAEVSTAGLWWYRNALAFFAPDRDAVIIRLGNGKTIGVDLAKEQPIPELPKALTESGRQRAREASAKLLTSDKPHERETGAIVSGQERIRKAIPRLKQLLKDDAYYIYSSDLAKWTRDYYVRKAADRALRSMGEAVGKVTLEEPHTGTDESAFEPSGKE